MKIKNGSHVSILHNKDDISFSTVFNADFFRFFFPLAFQSLLTSMISATDCIMLGMLSQEALTSITLASQLMQVFFFFLNATSIGYTSLASQYLGNSDMDSVRKISVITFRFSLIGGLLLFFITLVIPETVMHLFTSDPELITIGATYLKYLSITFIFMSISSIAMNMIKILNHVKISAAFATISVVLNIALNYLLIYGKLGFPSLGAQGAAIATTISRGVEFVLTIGYILFKKMLVIPIRDWFRRYTGLFRKFFRYTIPGVIQTCSWMIANSMCIALLGHLESDVIAATSVALILFNIGSSFVVGSYSTAAAVTLGKMLGRGEKTQAKITGDILLSTAAFIGAGFGLLVILFGPYAFPIFNTLTDKAVGYLHIMVYIVGIKLIGKYINHTLAQGILSSGGDVTYLSKLDFVNMWLIILPISALAAYVLKLPPIVVYIFINMDEFTKIYFMIHRYRQYTWTRNLTRKDWAPVGKYAHQIRSQIVEEMPLGVMVIMNTGLVVLANNACADLLGMPREEIEGSNYRTLFLSENTSCDSLSDMLIDVTNNKSVPQEMDLPYPLPQDAGQILHIRASYMEDEDCRVGLCIMISKHND